MVALLHETGHYDSQSGVLSALEKPCCFVCLGRGGEIGW
jgi:hypothetical protein